MAIPCAQLGTVNLDGTLVAADLRAIAADASGTMYGAAWDGKTYRISSAGATLGSLTTSTTNLTDIDLSATGQIIAGGRFGNVILTSTALSSQSSFLVGSNPLHVAFAAPVPEPAAGAIALAAAAAAAALVVMQRRR